MLSDTYDASVATGDFYLGRVLDALERQGLQHNTVIVVTSDHGEELLERGFMNHGHSLYAEQTRIPLVIAGPGIPRGERRAIPVAVRHVAPTLARFGGVLLGDLPDALDLAQDAAPAQRSIYLSTHRGLARGGAEPHHLIAVRRGDHMLHVDRTVGGQALGLFDPARDPGETRDLSAELPGLTAELTELALSLEREQRATAPVPRAGDPATLQMLRALGYLGGASCRVPIRMRTWARTPARTRATRATRAERGQQRGSRAGLGSCSLLRMSEEQRRAAYWARNVRYLTGLLLVWFLVSFVLGILLVEPLNRVRVFGSGFKLGFWFAQQGSIYVFVILIAVYVNLMNRLDREFGVDETE